MRAARVRFESAGARTVETFVCEELAVSSPFRSWLLERLDLDAFDSATAVRVRDAIGDPEASDPSRDAIGVELGLERGTVDLRIPDAADRLRAFAARYASVLPPATSLLADGDALVLRRSVPPVDLEGALEAVRDHLAVAERVRNGRA